VGGGKRPSGALWPFPANIINAKPLSIYTANFKGGIPSSVVFGFYLQLHYENKGPTTTYRLG